MGLLGIMTAQTQGQLTELHLLKEFCMREISRTLEIPAVSWLRGVLSLQVGIAGTGTQARSGRDLCFTFATREEPLLRRICLSSSQLFANHHNKI